MGESTNPRRLPSGYKPVGGVIMGRKLTPLEEYRSVEDRVLSMSDGLHRNLLLDTLRGIHDDILNEMTS